LIESDRFGGEVTAVTAFFQKFEKNILIESDRM
jgi:hypothetical protein